MLRFETVNPRRVGVPVALLMLVEATVSAVLGRRREVDLAGLDCACCAEWETDAEAEAIGADACVCCFGKYDDATPAVMVSFASSSTLSSSCDF